MEDTDLNCSSCINISFLFYSLFNFNFWFASNFLKKYGILVYMLGKKIYESYACNKLDNLENLKSHTLINNQLMCQNYLLND